MLTLHRANSRTKPCGVRLRTTTGQRSEQDAQKRDHEDGRLNRSTTSGCRPHGPFNFVQLRPYGKKIYFEVTFVRAEGNIAESAVVDDVYCVRLKVTREWFVWCLDRAVWSRLSILMMMHTSLHIVFIS